MRLVKNEHVNNRKKISSLKQSRHNPLTKLFVQSKIPELTKKVNEDVNCSKKSLFDANESKIEC